MAFKLEKTMADFVQKNSVDKVDDSATKLETSNSTVNPSGEASEGIAESSDSKEEKSSENVTKEKEVNISETTESEKCIGDALVESEKRGDSESGNLKNGISREDLKEALKKFGTVRVIIIHPTPLPSGFCFCWYSISYSFILLASKYGPRFASMLPII